MKNGFVGERDTRLAGSSFPPFAGSASGEPSVGRDEQIGKIFRNMRTALKVPRDALARRLATSTAVIDSFEAGAIGALPHWKETERIEAKQITVGAHDPLGFLPMRQRANGARFEAVDHRRAGGAVSYTHLTLPTICSV